MRIMYAREFELCLIEFQMGWFNTRISIRSDFLKSRAPHTVQRDEDSLFAAFMPFEPAHDMICSSISSITNVQRFVFFSFLRLIMNPIVKIIEFSIRHFIFRICKTMIEMIGLALIFFEKYLGRSFAMFQMLYLNY